MIITTYAGAFSKRPHDVADLTWGELVTELRALVHELPRAPESATREAQKRALPAWSPHALAPDTTCAKANVTEVSALVLDVDGGADPAAIIEQLKAHGWAGLLYASPSDTPEHRKFRVVSPVVDPIPPDVCAETRKAFAEALNIGPGSGVEEALDPSRILFVGKLHGSPEREIWEVPGRRIDAAALPPPVLAWGATKAPAAALVPLAELPPADAGVAAALGDWRAHAGRKWALCGAIGGVMRREGYSAAQCEAELRAWLPPNDPTVDVAAGVAWALEAWTLPAESVSGHAALAELVGAEHAAVIERASFAGTAVGRWAARRVPLVRAQPWARSVTGGEPSEPADPLGRRHSFSDAEVPLEYFCEGLRLAPSDGKISLIAGLPGAGKGPIADHLAACFTFGLPAFGQFACRRSRTLVLDCEGARLTMRRMRRMARALGVDARELEDVRDLSGVDVTSAAFHEALAREAPEVVVLDSYTSAMLATGLDSFKPEFAMLAHALGSLGCLVIAVAHANKVPAAGERPTLGNVAGSFALAAMAQTGLAVWHPKEDEPNLVRVACMRAPETSFAGFDVEFRDTPGDGLAVAFVDSIAAKRSEAADEAERLGVVAGRVLGFLRANPANPRTTNQIRDGVGGKHNSDAARAISALHRAGVLIDQPTARGLSQWLLAGDAPDAVAFDVAGDCAPVPRAAGAVGGFVRR